MSRSVFLLVLVLIIIMVTLTAAYLNKSVQNLIIPSPVSGFDDQLGTSMTGKGFNILVIGIDQRGSETCRSDTIMVYHFSPLFDSISLLSVPRDTYVSIPGRGMDKVNHAYAFGGIELSKKTLEDFLGITIDHCLEINFAGFVNIIDRMGGIEINVEKDLPEAGISGGRQRLDGEKALAYVRDRQEPMGDIARVKRQQEFIKALFEGIEQYENEHRLATEIPELYKSVRTDLSLEEIKELYSMVTKTPIEGSQMEIVPGSFYNLAGISYWKPDRILTRQVVSTIFNDGLVPEGGMVNNLID